MRNSRRVVRIYKDRLFKLIFGNPEQKGWTLSLYNAMNGTRYTDPNAIILNTIEDVVYMSMKNDVSFIIGDTLNFYEQQSTFNPNMPMRFLIYAGMIYSKYVEETPGYRRFSSSQQKAPTPKCVCFYNGMADEEDRITLRLSDSFNGDSDIEVKVEMININFGHNKELLDACKPLQEYAWFVDKVRVNQELMKDLEKAIDATIEEMSDEALLKPFLVANQAEVKLMCITEYDEERAFAEQREEGIEIGIEIGMEKGIAEGMEKGRAEGIEKGRKEGVEKGRLSMLIDLVKDGVLTVIEAAQRVNMTVSEFEAETGLKA